MKSNNIETLRLIKSQFATRIVGSELILVPIRNKVSDMDELFILDETGCFIWEQLNENTTESDIVNALISEFEVNDETAKKDVSEFLNKLINLLTK